MNDATSPISKELRRREQVLPADTSHSGARKPDLKDPRVVLSLLEADQVVAAKRQTHFGRRKLSLGAHVLFWALRLYVIFMLVIVVISALRAIHAMH